MALGLAFLPLTVVHPVRVQGRSMEPTLRNGQIVWALRSWAAGSPQHQQVWLLETPDGPALKRVLALPGEGLEIREGETLLQEQPLNEIYVHYPERGSTGPWRAGDGYLVLGDNRPESRDSRAWGPLPQSAFLGRIFRIAKPDRP